MVAVRAVVPALADPGGAGRGSPGRGARPAGSRRLAPSGRPDRYKSGARARATARLELTVVRAAGAAQASWQRLGQPAPGATAGAGARRRALARHGHGTAGPGARALSDLAGPARGAARVDPASLGAFSAARPASPGADTPELPRLRAPAA